MKKILLLAVAAILAAGTMQAQTADELRIYLNPGHGSWGPNDRPMATIPYPMLPDTGRPDTCGFYESNTNLWKVLQLGETLEKMGVQSNNIVYSRVKNGPYPYVSGAADEELYNRPLSEICEEVELGNFDMFISVHSNASTDGTNTNYPLYLYRGYDKGNTGAAGYDGDAVDGSWEMCDANWDYHYMNEIDPQSHYSLTSKNLRGDINFYGSYSTRVDPNTGNAYAGYLGVLKHGAPGFLVEGYFHTYQPARHRALNMDYCHQEGVRIARGVCDYFDLTPESTGYIMGTVKDLHEKITNSLFHYSPGTNDQWLPLNGATVKLLKDGNEVATYTVDNNYNGVFFFEGLEPGEYTLDATLDGYKPLFDEYKEPVTVTANATTYPLLFLENESYEPPTVVYENYPDPAQPGYLKVASEYVFEQSTQSFDFAGTIKDAVQIGDSTIVLTNEGKVPHLYLIKTSTKQLIKELSTEGIYTEDSPGFFSPLNAINRTADNKLVGVSLTENQFDGGSVADGYTRGTARVYIWNDIDEAPSLFTSTMNSGNYYNANVGHSIAVNGPSTGECEVLLTAMTTGSTCNIRLVHINMVNGEQSSVFHDNLYSAGFVGKQEAFGEELHLAVSPNGDDKTIIGGMGIINEFVTPIAVTGVPTEIKALSDEFGATGVGFQCFKYAGHSLLVTPYAEEGVVKGIKILDITGGVDQAKLIKTVNTDIVEVSGAPRKATHHDPILNGLTEHIATAIVNGEDIDATLVGANGVNFFTTEGVDQPVVKGIYAYGLDKEEEGDEYTFIFIANSDAVSGKIIFTDRETGEVLGEYPLTDVVEGLNTVTLTKDQIPGEDNTVIDWAINLVGNVIPNFGLINNPNDFNYTYSFNTVDNSPESMHFGRIYVGDRPSSGSAQNGIYIYEPDYTRVNDQVFNTRTDGKNFGSNWRMSMDSEGKLYVAEWGDGGSGVFVYNPDAEEQVFYNFFANEDGSPLSRNGDGLLTNEAGVSVASSTPSVFIAGEGADTKMFVYNEDMGNDVYIYNIGNPDGTLATYWNQAPSSQGNIGGYQLNTNGNVWGYPDGGFWVSQYRSAGNNTHGVPSLMYVDAEGNNTYNSGDDQEFAANYMNGSAFAGFAISNDGTELVINDGAGDLQFFELGWDGAKNGSTPILTHKYSFRASEALRSGGLQQINYDYAGNLICSGSKVGIYSVPTEDNQTTTPAQKALYIMKKNLTGVDGVDVNKTVKAVKYVNLAGQMSTRPFDGVNIVVTTYDDGSQTVTKVIR